MDTLTSSSHSYRQYLVFFIGQNISLMGSAIVQFAITWWIVAKTQDPLLVSLVYTFTFLPYLIVMPISGVFADRGNHKKLMIVSDGVQSFCTGILIFFFSINFTVVWAVLSLFIIRGIAQGLQSPASKAIVLYMVPKEKLEQINGYGKTFEGIITIFAPAIAVFLMMKIPLQQIFWIDILTYGFALVPLIRMKKPNYHRTPLPIEKTIQNRSRSPFIQFFSELFEGMRLIYQKRGIFLLILFIILFNIIYSPFMALLPIYIFEIYAENERMYAFVLLVMNIGYACGGAMTSVLKSRYSLNNKFLGACIIFFCGSAGFILIPSSFLFMKLACIFINGMMLAYLISIYTTIFQRSFLPEIQGRINAIESFLTYLSIPLGSFVTGIIARYIDISLLLSCLMILGFVSSAMFWGSPWRKIPFSVITKHPQSTSVEREIIQKS